MIECKESIKESMALRALPKQKSLLRSPWPGSSSVRFGFSAEMDFKVRMLRMVWVLQCECHLVEATAD
jgi:hypothetical protein